MKNGSVRVIIWVAIGAAAAGYVWGIYLPKRRARERFNAAADLLKAREYGKAIEAFGELEAAAERDKELAKMLPQHLARAYAGRAQTRAAAADLDGAIADFRAAAEHAPALAEEKGWTSRIRSLQQRRTATESNTGGG